MISSLCFDVYECIQVILTPDKLDKDGKEVHFGWIDINRLKILSKVPVLTHPEFSIKYPSFKDKHKTYKKVHGPANKPLR